MPVVLRALGLRFLFYSDEGTEPPHVHVVGNGGEAKFWIRPQALAYAHGFKRQDLRRIDRAVAANLDHLNAAWDEYFA